MDAISGFAHPRSGTLSPSATGLLPEERRAPIFAPAAATPEAVRRRIQRNREAVRSHIQTLVGVVVGAGKLPAGVDPHVLSHALLAIGDHFGRLLTEDPTALDPDAVADTLSAMLTPGRQRRSPVA